MIIPNLPHMDEQGLIAFKEYVSCSQVYLEYGCGGSTSYAAEVASVPTIISVETDLAWIKAMTDRFDNIAVDVYLEHCDIGPVANWGRPTSNLYFKKYPSYMSLPWKRAKALGVMPDTVLIDGRFRVASFLYSLVNARIGTKILFDDYLDRAYYHVVEQFCSVDEIHGRMAVFSVSHNYSFSSIVEQIALYSIDPA